MDATPGIISAFILGLFSTMHCIGMCGGIIGALSLSLPEPVRKSKPRLISFVTLYNVGRVFSYTVAGFGVGYIGSAAVGFIDMSDGPSILRYTGALFMLAIGLYIAGWVPQISRVEVIGKPLWRVIEPMARKLMPVDTSWKALLYGTAWGWLPCGMVYFALMWALTSGSPTEGAMMMMAFGLGTMPSLIATGLSASWLTRFTRSPVVRQLVGFTVILMAVAAVMMPMGHKHGGGHGGHDSHTGHTMNHEMPVEESADMHDMKHDHSVHTPEQHEMHMQHNQGE